MTAPSDTLQAQGARPDAASAVLARLRPFWWSVRRELWENRSIWRGPMLSAGLVLLALLLSHLHTLHLHVSGPGARRETMPAIAPYAIACGAVLVTGLIIGVVYSAGALLRERRDRSILFWKSLPVSNLTVVLSKAAVPLLAIPAITFAIIVVTHLVIFVAGAVTLMTSAPDQLAPVNGLDIVRLDGTVLYGIVALALWQAPVWGWFLMVSAWAKRVPLLWAVGPWVVLGVMENIVFGGGSHYVNAFVNERILGGIGVAFDVVQNQQGFHFTSNTWPDLTPITFVTTPDLWIGLAFAAAFFVAAAWLRRRGEPI